jgi:quercetin dioxygenase-like cupin family protein
MAQGELNDALCSGVFPSEISSIVMTTRRNALAAAFALLTEAAATAQNKSGQADRGPVFQHELPNITMDDWQVTVSEVPYPPGRVGPIHHHAGFVLAYVLEGNVVTKVSGQPEKVYKTGEMFYEPPGSTHEVSKNASSTEPAKLLALIFAKKGETLTMPGPAGAH